MALESKGSSRRPPKIVFGLMSAVASAATVDQLVASLQPHHVVIHHDFSQQPDFAITAPNASYVPDPKRTGYGVWALTEGVVHLVKYCVENVDFDYFQLISPACLPIKPLSQFEDYLSNSTVDGHAEFCDLRQNIDAMICFGFRVYAPDKSFRQCVLRRTRQWYIGDNPDLVDGSGIQVAKRRGDLPWSPLASIASMLIRIADKGWLGFAPPDSTLRPMMGGLWFGARKEVCAHLVRRMSEPAVHAYFESVNDFGEYGFATLLGNSGYRFGPFNTFVDRFEDWNPRTFGLDDLEFLASVPNFFARKFPDDPMAPIRLRVLERIKPYSAVANIGDRRSFEE
ncbi:MAG: hypothetical protein ACSLE5_06125 [Porticoccaceae bacterium]